VDPALLETAGARSPGGVTGLSSPSWDLTAFLITAGRIGCVPGVDFGPGGEGYLRFCFARDRSELTGAIESMRKIFWQP
jgi:aspartate/methionine/tyrosine aminotransferase